MDEVGVDWWSSAIAVAGVARRSRVNEGIIIHNYVIKSRIWERFIQQNNAIVFVTSPLTGIPF